MSFKTVPQMFQHLVNERPTLKTFYTKTDNGWEGVELTELQKLVEDFANGLKNLGINEHDKVAIIGANSRLWAISDYAIAHIRAVSVPVYPTLIPAQSQYVVEHSESKIAIVQDEIQLDKVHSLINDANSNLHTIVIMDDNYNGGKDNVVKYSDVFNMKDTQHDIRSISATVQENDLLTPIYTSGTTGNPKGVMLSHGGILSNCEGAQEILETLVEKDLPVFLTWLPLSHSYEHTVQYVQIFLGAKVYYAESLEKLLLNMSVAKPTIMTAVPRFYQNLYNKISVNLNKQSGLKKALINKTIKLGKKTLNNEKLIFYEKLTNFYVKS